MAVASVLPVEPPAAASGSVSAAKLQHGRAGRITPSVKLLSVTG